MRNRFVDLPLFRQADPQVGVNFRRFRTELQRFLQMRNRLIHIVLLDQRMTQVALRTRVGRVQFDRLLKIPDRLVDLPLHGQRQAQVVVRMGVPGIALDRLTIVTHCLIQPAQRSQREAEIVVCLGVIRINGHRLLILLDGLVEPSLLGQRAAQIAVSFCVAGVLLDRQLVLLNGLIAMTGGGERYSQIVVRLRVDGLGGDRLAVFGDRLLHLASVCQGLAEVVVSPGIAGTHCHCLGPLGNGGSVLAFLRHVRGHIVLLVEVHRRRVDVLDAAGRHVDELRYVHGAIGRGRVLDQDCGRVVALRIDVGEEHLRVGRAALRGEDQPAAVGREAVPGVHQRRVAGHAPGLAARGRNNVELAIGAHQLAVVGLDKDYPLAIRRELGKAIAHAVL